MTALRTTIEINGITEQMKKLEEMDHTATRRLFDGMKKIAAIVDKKVAADMSSVAASNLSAMRGGIGGGMTALAPANPALPGKLIQHEVYIRGAFDVLGVVNSRSRRYMRMAQAGRAASGKHPPQSQMRKWVASVMGISDRKELKRVAAVVGHAIATGGVGGQETLEKSRQAVLGVLMDVMKAETDRLMDDLAVKGTSSSSVE